MTIDELRQTETDGTLPAYAWPGGYPVIYFTRDGLTICPDCANREVDDRQAVDGWQIYYEGPDMVCEDCENTVLSSAYGDTDMLEEGKQ